MWWVLGILGYFFIGVFAMICYIAFDHNQSILNAIDDVINWDFDSALILFVFIWPVLIPAVLFIGIYRGSLWIINFIAIGISRLVDFLKKSNKKEASKSKSSDNINKVKEKVKTVITEINEW